jgi:antitoxin component YwqK of YwqJK toxin-antitoxin module
MKATLFLLLVILVTVGCGDSQDSSDDLPTSNTSTSESPFSTPHKVKSLSIPDNLDEILSGAIDAEKLVERNDDQSEARVAYDPNTDLPYTGWAKVVMKGGPPRELWKVKAGLADGLFYDWHGNGIVSTIASLKENKQTGPFIEFHRNGKKSTEGSKIDRKNVGLCIYWYSSGQKEKEVIYKKGKPMSVVVWKPNGDKCPETNVKDGNGELVRYSVSGTEINRETYKDGKQVFD